MTIDEELTQDMKDAMRAKATGTLACVRSVKAKMKETTTAKGFSGEVDDTLWRRVIGGYVKQLEKAIPELEAAGERGKDLVQGYKAEIAYLDKYLPKRLGEAETRALVLATLKKTGVTDPKRVGQVVGAIMKEHKDTVDAGLAKKIAEEILGGAA